MLVASKIDSAGMNIAKECEKLGMKVHYAEEDIIRVRRLPESDYYIFLSKHKSESEMPCLTCHFPGNFSGDASYGGNPKELGMTYPSLEKTFIRALEKIKHEWSKPELEKYQIIIEATHHGPTHFDKPVLFVEIGSSEKEWKDKAAAELVAAAVKKTVENIKNEKFTKTAIGFGGTHYPEKFTKELINGEFAIGHILPKYQNENMCIEIFDQMAEKSIEPVKYVIIDWKGINQKSKITEWTKDKGFEIVKI
jgi:D-aminoacyl-tRNA deacylase